MSDRLATSSGDISHFHISLPAAHTVLTQACLGVLLRDPDVIGGTDIAPLARYAAENWMAHAQVENVVSKVRDGMETLFDPDKPYFEAWVQLHNVDVNPPFFGEIQDTEPRARPLYYAALCGFRELVERLILTYPQYASAKGGHCGTALHSAACAGHLHVVRSLLRHGIDVNVGGYQNKTALLYASWLGHRDVVQFLLDHDADVNSRDDYLNTPLNFAAASGRANVIRTLLEHNADINSKDKSGCTPLHDVLDGYDKKGSHSEVVRLLLAYGANTNAENTHHRTPLHLAADGRLGPDLDVARLLLEHGADVDHEDERGRTPLQVALAEDRGEIVQLFSEFRSARVESQA